jgi:hypothetical protein
MRPLADRSTYFASTQTAKVHIVPGNCVRSTLRNQKGVPIRLPSGVCYLTSQQLLHGMPDCQLRTNPFKVIAPVGWRSNPMTQVLSKGVIFAVTLLDLLLLAVPRAMTLASKPTSFLTFQGLLTQPTQI